MRKLTNNKIAKGLVSLFTIIVLLSSILASSIYYGNSITANVIREVSIDSEPTAISIKEVNDIKELSYLNEGWYQITNGYVYYLEHFDSYAPLFIRVKNPEQQNGILGVEEDGTTVFYKGYSSSLEKEVVDEKELVENEVTGEVSGLEKVSGFAEKEIKAPIFEKIILVRTITVFGKRTPMTIHREFVKQLDNNWYDPYEQKVVRENIFDYITKNYRYNIKEGTFTIIKQGKEEGTLNYEQFEKKYSPHVITEKIPDINLRRDGIQRIIDSPTTPLEKLENLLKDPYATEGQKAELSEAISERKKVQEILQSSSPTAADLDFVFNLAFYVSDEERTKLAERAQSLRAAGNKEVIEFSKQLPGLLEEWAEQKPRPTVPRKPKPIVLKKGDAYEPVASDDATNVVRYIYKNAPQATVADIVKQVFNVDELDPDDLENYRITVDSQEVRLAREPSGELQFYRVMDVDSKGTAKPNTKRFVMKDKDTFIITIHDRYYVEEPAVVTPPPTPTVSPEPLITIDAQTYGPVRPWEVIVDVKLGTTQTGLKEIIAINKDLTAKGLATGTTYAWDEDKGWVPKKDAVNPPTITRFEANGNRYEVIAVRGKFHVRVNDELKTDENEQNKVLQLFVEQGGKISPTPVPTAPPAPPAVAPPTAPPPTDLDIDKELTEEFKETIERYIKSASGNPANWKIDEKGNFICVNDKGCSLILEIDNVLQRAIFFNKGQTFAPPGGYYVGKLGVGDDEDEIKDENVNALLELERLLKKEPLEVEVIKPEPIKPAEPPPHLIKLAEDLQKKGATSEQIAAILQKIKPSDKVRISKDSLDRTYVILVTQDTEDVYDSKGNLVIIARLSETGEVKKIDKVNVGVTIADDDARKIISEAIEVTLIPPTPPKEVDYGGTDGDATINNLPAEYVDSTKDFVVYKVTENGVDKFYAVYRDDPIRAYQVIPRKENGITRAYDFIHEEVSIEPLVEPKIPPPPAPAVAPPPELKRVLSVAELKQGLPVASSNIKSISKPDKEGIVTVELEDGRKIQLKKGQGLDTETFESLPEFKGKEVLPTVPVGLPRPKEEKTILSGTVGGKRIDVFAPDEKGMHTIKINGEEAIKVHKDLLPKLTLENWDGIVRDESGGKFSLTVREKNKATIVSVNLDGTQVVKTETYDEKRQLTSRTETIRLADGTTTATATQNLQEPAKLQKTETVTYSSGIKKEIKYEQGQEALTDKASITFTSQKGDKITMKDTALRNMPANLDEQGRLMQAAFDAGITQIDKYDNGFQQGDRRVWVGDDGSVASIKGKEYISGLLPDGTYRTYKNLEATFTAEGVPTPNYKPGWRIVETKNGNLIRVQENLQGELYLQFDYTGNNKDGYTELKISEGDRQTLRYVGTLNLKQIDDPNSKFYGRYELLRGTERLYFEPSYGPFGLVGLNFYDESGNKLSDESIGLRGLRIQQFLEKAINQARLVRKELTDAQKASQAFFADVERVFTEFQGLGYYATLFIDQDSLLQWRENVDRAFATAYLGTEYWASAICSQSLDGEDVGIAYAETPQGLAQIGAHVEATRTPPIIDETGSRQFIYKITFNVRNGDYAKDLRAPEEMNINIELRGEKTVNVFKKGQNIKRGSTFGRLGRSAIVQDSKTLFNEVCITFDNIPFRWKLSDKILCNKIQESTGEPTKIKVPTPTTAPGVSPDSDINDF